MTVFNKCNSTEQISSKVNCLTWICFEFWQSWPFTSV